MSCNDANDEPPHVAELTERHISDPIGTFYKTNNCVFDTLNKPYSLVKWFETDGVQLLLSPSLSPSLHSLLFSLPPPSVHPSLPPSIHASLHAHFYSVPCKAVR